MNRGTLYQPNKKWRIAVAFAAAVLIHFAAVTFATIYQSDSPKDFSSGDEFPPIDVTTGDDMNPPLPPDVPQPPPILLPADNLFPEMMPTPPPPTRNTRPRERIVRPAHTTSGLQSLSAARISALNAPRPEYPYEARRQKVTGNGIVVMAVDVVSGRVFDVMMEKSTGSLVLDNAAISGFRRWRFKPGTTSRVRSPITFTLTGAKY